MSSRLLIHQRVFTSVACLGLMLVFLATAAGGAFGQIVLPAASDVNTIAGDGSLGYSGNGGAATSAELDYPVAGAVDSNGNVYVADDQVCVIREVTGSNGNINTVAGNGTCGYSGDGGAATSAELHFPNGIAVDSAGNLYIADTSNNRIRKVTASTGDISTFAGDGTAGYSGDGGSASSAELNGPSGVAVDFGGNVYIADAGNYRIRKVTASTGDISTVAGDGTEGTSGDGGSATSAELTALSGVTVDSGGNLYIAGYEPFRSCRLCVMEYLDSAVREVVASTGTINTFAGDYSEGYSGDGGSATSAELNGPSGLAVDPGGNVYIADMGNNVIREVTASTGVINTIAGEGTAGYSGDGGLATSAEFDEPDAVAVDAAGNIYIADQYNERLRTVAAGSSLPAPPSGATNYASLECWGLSGYPGSQNYTSYPKWGWQNYSGNGTCADGNDQTGSVGNGGTFSCNQQTAVAETSACGSLETLNGPPNTGTTELNVLDQLSVCGYGTGTDCPSTIEAMEDTLQFVVPQETAQTYQGLEFDPDVTWSNGTTNYSYKISVSCEFHPTDDSNNPDGNPEWEYWDSSANTWKPFENLGLSSYIPCGVGKGRHSLQLYATLDTTSNTYYYEEMIVDNQILFNQTLGPVTACDTSNLSGPCPGYSQYIGVEQQIDNNTATSATPVCNPSSSTTMCAYYDHYELSVW